MGLVGLTTTAYGLQDRVIDGDTVAFEKESKHRLACINAPELNEPYGQESKERLVELLDTDKPITYHYYGEDSFGRMITEIYVGETNINQTLVAEGLAEINKEYFDKCLNKEQYESKQTMAKLKGLGIWGKVLIDTE